MKHIHIVGSGPRTGTTLLAEAMIACFGIDLHHAHEARIYAAAPPGDGAVYLSKAVKDILVVHRFLPLDPELHVVCMIRDPRDMIVSRHGKDPDRYWAGLRYWHTYIAAWRKVRDHPRLVTVRYEDLVADPDATQAAIERRMPFLERVGPFSRYHELAEPSDKSRLALGGVRPIGAEGVGSWRRHLPRVAGQLALHPPITDDLVAFGYEPDDTWTSVLEGVAPDLSPGHWPESFSKPDLLRRVLPAYVAAARLKLQGSRR